MNEIMDAQADMAREDGATSRNGYRERGLATHYSLSRRQRTALFFESSRIELFWRSPTDRPGWPSAPALSEGPGGVATGADPAAEND